MKVFLYGSRGAGKSTIIKRLLDELKLKPSGFLTVRGPAGAEGRCDFFIVGAPGGKFDQDNRIAYSYSDGRWESYSEVFDNIGVGLLTFSGKPEIVVMDELGFMEARAGKFQKRVLEILDEDILVIGVLKRKPEPFLKKISSHPSVITMEVTEENRDGVYAELKEMLSQSLGDK